MQPFITVICTVPSPKAGEQKEDIRSQSCFCNLSCMSMQWETCLSWQWQHCWIDSIRHALHFADTHSAYVRVVLGRSNFHPSVFPDWGCFSSHTRATLWDPAPDEHSINCSSGLCCVGAPVWDETFSVHRINKHYKLGSDQLLTEDYYEILKINYYT